MKKKTFVLPFAYFSGCFFAASAGYSVVGWLTRLILGRTIVFGAVTSEHPVPLYHYIHPFQYIAVVAFVYAWVASVWTLLPRHASNRWLRKIEILIVLVVSVVASLPLDSLLFSVHDMLAGFVPTHWHVKLAHDLGRTFSFAFPILARAMLFCIPGLFVGTVVTDAVDSWYRAQPCRGNWKLTLGAGLAILVAFLLFIR